MHAAVTDHVYSADFYTYIDEGSRASARHFAELILRAMPVSSLLDIGAGHGAWAAEWMAAGVPDVVAVDGDYVRRDQLAIPATHFRAHDLTTPLTLGRRFDLVQTLEVAEHLPAADADVFIDNLVAHGDVILFSAAVPHQGGEHHVNEQPPEYWRQRFAARGYAAYDWLRPRLTGAREVMPWYRFNAILYANAAGQARLGPDILASRAQAPLAIGGDLGWTVRRMLVRMIPKKLVKPIAMAKASLEARVKTGRRAE